MEDYWGQITNPNLLGVHMPVQTNIDQNQQATYAKINQSQPQILPYSSPYNGTFSQTSPQTQRIYAAPQITQGNGRPPYATVYDHSSQQMGYLQQTPQQSQIQQSHNHDSFEERIRTLAEIDEERVLTVLSSPEPELEELLFPEVINHTLSFPQQTVPKSEIPPPSNYPPTQASSHQPTTHKSSSKSKKNGQSSCSQDSMQVLLFHKPRGCKGVWQQVENSDALRVTKGKGKWLKLEVRCKYQIKPEDVDIFLVDPTTSSKLVHSEEEGVSIESKIESTESSRPCIEVELKLDRVAKRLQFWAVVNTPSGILKAKSIDFSAHNNGKANNKVKIEEPSDKSDTPSESSSSSSAVSSSQETNIVTLKKRRRQDSLGSLEDSDVPSSVVPGSLKVNGVVRAKAFLQYSDIRLKANIGDLMDAVNIVTQLKGRTYTWRHNELEPNGGKRVIGLIAQEVRRVLPEVVHENENGLLSVSYAEIVPVLIEAFKEHLKEYQTDKQEVKQQLEILESKLDTISSQLEEQEAQRMKEQQLQQLSPQQFISQPTVVHVPIIQGPVIKGILFNETKVPMEQQIFKKQTERKKNLLRTGVILSFLLGITTIMLAAVLLGMTVSSPQQTISISVIEATDIQPMDRDGYPDPFCEVVIGSQVFRTRTLWNIPSPVWDATFDSPLEKGINKISFHLYDDDPNPYFPPRRMGLATVSLSGLETETTYTEWLPLTPSIETEQISGSMRISLYITAEKKPGYEILLLFAGIFLASISVGLGFYVWRSSKELTPLPSFQPKSV